MSSQINIFGISIDALTKQAVVQQLSDWLAADVRDCRYVVTPNVDHIVRLAESAGFRAAYSGASLTLADGKPIVAVSKLLFGDSLSETVPGSDLVPLLFDHVSNSWRQPLSAFLLGAAPGVADKAANKIHSLWKNVEIVGTYSPPMKFEDDSDICDFICKQISELKPDLLIIGLGAPKQELWVSRYSGRLPVKVALCVGATIDFLAGEKSRAPTWIQTIGLEWLHRLLMEPKRLAKRYAYDAMMFPGLILKEFCLRCKNQF